jgi:hypothetical protein
MTVHPSSTPAPDEGTGVPSGGYSVPAPPLAVQPLKPLDYNAWWARGMWIVQQSWRQLAAVQGIGAVAVTAVQVFPAIFLALRTNQLTRDLNDTAGSGAAPDLSALWGLLGYAIVLGVVSIVTSAAITVATVHIAASVTVGAPPDVGAAFRLALRRALPMIGWQLLAVPIYLVAICACVVPVLYVYAVFLILPVVVAVERGGAIGRCFGLFHADLGAAVARVATIAGILIGTGVLGNLLGTIISGLVRSVSPEDSGLIVATVLSTLVSVLLSSAVLVVVTPLILSTYLDLRARAEPITADRLAAGLSIARPAVP